MKFSQALLSLLSVAPFAAAEVFLKEQFNDEAWKDRWTVPTGWKSKSELGEWKHTAGAYFADENDKGIQTSENHRFYGLSAKLQKPFVSGEKKELVLQYSVKHEQKLDCGGAYIKLLPGGDAFDADQFGGDTPYAVMFGPDICGSANKRTHVILNYPPKDENLLINKEIPPEKDNVSHLYTLVIRPDNTFEVFVDNKSVRAGKLEDEFDFLEPKQIKDPDAKKPADWVDVKKIPDPEEKKPEGYDDIPKEIADPEATKPEDWSDEDDGQWEPPMIDNPEYKGEWKPKMIDNPEYKGKWEHPMIDNPDYKYDADMYKVCKNGCTHVGFELWQVTAGTIFDDIIVTDSLEEAQKFGEETFFKKKDAEKASYDKFKEEENKKEEDGEEPEIDLSAFEGMGDEF